LQIFAIQEAYSLLAHEIEMLQAEEVLLNTHKTIPN